MKVRIVDLEGTPEELSAFPELVAALSGHRGTKPSVPSSVDQDNDEPLVPSEIREHLWKRSGDAGRAQRAERFIAEVLSWGNTEPELGNSKRFADGHMGYVRLHWKGPRNLGAFAYVAPYLSRVTVRLPASALENGAKHARRRKVQAKNKYAITIPLEPQAAFEEALVYARKALEGVEAGGEVAA